MPSIQLNRAFPTSSGVPLVHNRAFATSADIVLTGIKTATMPHGYNAGSFSGPPLLSLSYLASTVGLDSNPTELVSFPPHNQYRLEIKAAPGKVELQRIPLVEFSEPDGAPDRLKYVDGEC